MRDGASVNEEIDELHKRLTAVEQKIAPSSFTIMSVDPPELTSNKQVNSQLIMYFFVLIILVFISQVIGFLTNLISQMITLQIFWILLLGAFNTLLIGGAVKMVQKQLETVSNNYNTVSSQKSIVDTQVITLQKKCDDLQSQLNNRDAELIALKTKNE